MIEPRTVWSFVVGLSLACGPVVDDGRLEQPVWIAGDLSLDDGTILDLDHVDGASCD